MAWVGDHGALYCRDGSAVHHSSRSHALEGHTLNPPCVGAASCGCHGGGLPTIGPRRRGRIRSRHVAGVVHPASVHQPVGSPLLGHRVPPSGLRQWCRPAGRTANQANTGRMAQPSGHPGSWSDRPSRSPRTQYLGPRSRRRAMLASLIERHPSDLASRRRRRLFGRVVESHHDLQYRNCRSFDQSAPSPQPSGRWLIEPPRGAGGPANARLKTQRFEVHTASADR